MQLEFHVLDVFTTQRYAGNPLAVVHGADALETRQMHAIAREFNLSETVFVMAPVNPAHTARIRIFTPGGELPFAGHPTVGTAVLLAELKTGGAVPEQLVALEENIGIVRVGVRLPPGEAPFAEFDAPRLPQEIGEAPANERIALALGLLPSEIGFANHKPTRFSAGVPYTYVPVASLEAIGRALPQAANWQAAFDVGGHNAAYLYTRETVSNASAYHARMFFPAPALLEDPATGSAAAGFAGPIHRFDQPRDGQHRRTIEQGFEMGRPSLITLHLDVQGGKLDNVRIGGHAVRVSEGRINV